MTKNIYIYKEKFAGSRDVSFMEGVESPMTQAGYCNSCGKEAKLQFPSCHTGRKLYTEAAEMS